jgi:hypothetical protein
MPVGLTQRLRRWRRGSALDLRSPLLLSAPQRPAPSAGTAQATPPRDTAAFVAAALVACSAVAAVFIFDGDSERTPPASGAGAVSRQAQPAARTGGGIGLRAVVDLPTLAHPRRHAHRKHRRQGVRHQPTSIARPSPRTTPVPPHPQPTVSAPTSAPPPPQASPRPAPRRRSGSTPTFDSSGEPFDSSG